jgi:hypothetical protein
MNTTAWRVIAAAGLTAGLLTGCARPAETVSATSASAPDAGPTSSPSSSEPLPHKPEQAWTPGPAAPDEKVYRGTGVRTVPAPANASPKITRQQAIDIAQKTEFYNGGLLPGTPQTELRLYTDGDFPPDGKGKSYRQHDHQLAWVVTYYDSPPDIKGPNRKLPPEVYTAKCDFVVVVDANTGDTLDLFQNCPGTPADQRPAPTPS